VDIVDLIGRFVPLRKAGKDWFAPCPFHADQDPSFSVSQVKQMFFCFGCSASGDLFDFWARFHQVSFPQAVRAIAEAYHIGPASGSPPVRPAAAPGAGPHPAWQPDERELPAEAWIQKAGAFVAWCYEQLYATSEALAYVHGRGLRDDTITAFGLGWNGGKGGKDLYRSREAWGLSPEKSEKTGRARALWLPVGMVIPRFRNGAVVMLRIRRPEPRTLFPDIKYYFVPGGMPCTLCCPPRPAVWASGLPRPLAYVVVESELDALLLHQEAGDLCGTVAVGSASARPDAATTTKLSQALCILNALDYDKAGAENRAWWQREFPQTARWPVPQGKDPDEAWQAGVDLREWILAGLPEGLRP